MKRHRGTSIYSGRETNLKELYDVQFQVYDILEKTKLKAQYVQWLIGVRRRDEGIDKAQGILRTVKIL